ncbi:MAG TPA: ACP S-malonyltransferase [Phycisphaerales bacterium]|nr:ACP S-malonyltransferase [Phycisphaerales bacterium]
MSQSNIVVLCPGQGAQAVGMGGAWVSHAAAKAVFDEADSVLGDSLSVGLSLSQLCFNGPAEILNRTDVSQPAIYTVSVACFRALFGSRSSTEFAAVAGLSLGEYTALHIAGAFSFADGLRLVAQRGMWMQKAAEAEPSSMVALIGADEAQAQSVCDQTQSALLGRILVCANFNAPGQIVLSGHADACAKAVEIASSSGLRATPLTVAGAFHSPLMQSAADKMAEILAATPILPLKTPVWSNVSAKPHDSGNPELLRHMLVQQIVSPVRWSQSCADLSSVHSGSEFHEVAPGSVLKGLMRRIDRNIKVVNHDEP